MFRKKVYGQSKAENCPFCGKRALTENSQGIPVCLEHKNEELVNFKCVCGEELEIRKGKWGPYFLCISCGSISFKKGLDMNPNLKSSTSKEQEKAKKTYKPEKETKDNITVSSDELDLFY